MDEQDRALQLLEELTEELTGIVVGMAPGELRSKLLDMSEPIDDFLLETPVTGEELEIEDYDDLDDSDDSEDEEEAA